MVLEEFFRGGGGPVKNETRNKRLIEDTLIL